MTAEEAGRLLADGAVDANDIAPTLKPKPGEEFRDVVLRLDRFSEARLAVETYLSVAWMPWAQAERPRLGEPAGGGLSSPGH